MKIFVETGRLILREILPSDDAGMFALDSDPDVHRYLGNKPVTHIEQSRELIEYIRKQYELYGIGRWAVAEKKTGDFIGWAGLKYVTDTINGYTGFYDLGYRLMKSSWGMGYATETANAAIDYAFNTLNIDELNGMTVTGNIASQNVLQKAGFIYVEDFIWNDLPHKWFVLKR